MVTAADVANALPRVASTARMFVRGQEDRDDLMQDTFVLAMEKLDTYRDDHLSGWLRKVMRTAFQKSHRRGAGRRGQYTYAAPTISVENLPGFDVADPFDQETYYDAQVALQMMQSLPPQQRMTLMRCIEGDTQNEIAQAMNISGDTVKTHLARAREAMRKVS